MGQLGVDDNSATTGLSYNGKELYIYRDDDFDGNIYVSFSEMDYGPKLANLVKTLIPNFGNRMLHYRLTVKNYIL